MYGFEIKPMYALILANCKLSDHYNKMMFDEVCETKLSAEELLESFDRVTSLSTNIVNYFSEHPKSNHKILLAIRKHLLEKLEEPPPPITTFARSHTRIEYALKEKHLIEYMNSESFSDMRTQ